jgi:prepilin-type N-terminal cleavage/methylation domain-containing protein
MIRGLRPQQSGFTLIEIIIVMSVSIGLIGGAITLFNTRIPQAQFNSGMTELASKMSTTANEVVNGHYPSTNNIRCSGSSLTTGAKDQGTNEQCIVLGRVIHFASQESDCSSGSLTDCNQMNIFTVYGQRTNGGVIVTRLSDATPKLVYNTTESILPETYTFSQGMRIEAAKIGGGSDNIAGVAFIQTFGSDLDGSDPVGNPQVQAIPLYTNAGMSLGMDTGLFVNQAESYLQSTTLTSVNPKNGINLCLRSGTGNRFGIVAVGDGGRSTNAVKRIVPESEYNGVCG